MSIQRFWSVRCLTVVRNHTWTISICYIRLYWFYFVPLSCILFQINEFNKMLRNVNCVCFILVFHYTAFTHPAGYQYAINHCVSILFEPWIISGTQIMIQNDNLYISVSEVFVCAYICIVIETEFLNLEYNGSLYITES